MKTTFNFLFIIGSILVLWLMFTASVADRLAADYVCPLATLTDAK